MRQRPRRNFSNDPIFWDIVADLGQMELKLDQVWVLLEKILRIVEPRDGADRER